MKHITILCATMIFIQTTRPSAQSSYILSSENPFASISLNNYASPALADIDADGDLDLFVGQYGSNEMLFYRNTGTATDAVYEQQTGSENPLENYFNNSGCCAPVFVDIDGDGDQDMFSGVWVNIIRFFRNDGDAMIPAYVYITGAEDPLGHVLTEGICTYPAFVDIDGDMDADVFITDANGNILYYENTGDANVPVFELNELDNPLVDAGLTTRSKIAFQDINGDGLVDAVIGHDLPEPEVLYFENTGSTQAVMFELKTGTDNPFEDIMGAEALAPVFGDLDDDGDKDLVIGTSMGIRLYEAVKTSSVSDDTAKQMYAIYPNPTVNNLTIDAGNAVNIELINMQGVVIYRIKSSLRTTLDVSTLSRGAYILKMTTDTAIFVEKVLVQ